MYLAINICICYNADRQRNVENSMQAKNESPDRNGVQSGDSSFLFIVAKRPLGYWLPLSCLSSHLLMRWQTTPAVTVTRNVKNNSMQTPPPVAGCRLDNTSIITYQQIIFYHVLEGLYNSDCGWHNPTIVIIVGAVTRLFLRVADIFAFTI